MSGLLLALTLLQAASGNDFHEEIQLLRTAGAFDLSSSARTCVRVGVQAYQPNTDELGNLHAAASFVRRTLAGCDIDGIRITIVAALRRTHSSLSRRQAERVAELEINTLRVEAEQLVARNFRLPRPSPPVPVLVPDRYPPTKNAQED